MEFLSRIIEKFIKSSFCHSLAAQGVVFTLSYSGYEISRLLPTQSRKLSPHDETKIILFQPIRIILAFSSFVAFRLVSHMTHIIGLYYDSCEPAE